MNSDEFLSTMRQAVVDGDEDAARSLAEQVLAEGKDAMEAVDRGFVAGIREAGDLWEEGEFFLPELVTAAQAMKAAMAVLQPALGEKASVGGLGKVVIGTVQGDIHDIGKTLVATMLSAGGFDVVDLGADVPVERFVDAAVEHKADLVCASALLTTTMVAQGDLVTKLADAGASARVMVGGAPVTASWASDIGAHGQADNAVAAVAVARELTGHG